MQKDSIIAALTSALKALGVDEPRVQLEHPSELKNGDYATGAALQYSKQIGISPQILAESIVAALGTINGVEKVEIAGPGFVNFYLAPSAIVTAIDMARNVDMWGANTTLAEKKIMVEYTDPNPFKEFHIGHLMSNAIGESISRLLQFSGAEVKRANYQGDVGPHVAKAIWGMKQAETSINDSKALGDAYVAGAKAYEEDPAAKAEMDTINAKVYDRSDSEINELYDAGRKTSLEHFEALYAILGTKFDAYFFESETAPRGVALVKAHPEVFEESEGAVVYKGEKVGLHTRVFLTSKGLPTYETKDLGLAELKSETWPADVSITITANEQKEYFAVMLAALKEIMPEISAKIVHVTHGMMRLESGKMSSRTGDVITGESLLMDLSDAARERATESRADDKDQLAQQVAVAAIKYQILKQGSGKDIVFDRERALSLEGDSGPYLQYAHARTHQIVDKAGENYKGVTLIIPDSAGDLARFLSRFPDAVEYAAQKLEPHLLVTYLIELASMFNSWYAQEHILDGSPEQAHKVILTDAVRKTLKNGLWILGIPAPEKM